MAEAITSRVASIFGTKQIAETIERFGIMDRTPREYSMAFGTGETLPVRQLWRPWSLRIGGRSIGFPFCPQGIDAR
jgi:membrane carboxypeptidase/penicillin-binding protein